MSFAIPLEYYLVLKLVHLAAAIVWSASAVGAWWFVVVSWWQRRHAPDDAEIARRDEWVRYHFLVVVILEHIAFAVLVPTGLMLADTLGMVYSLTPWLWWKAFIVLAIFVPMEIYDIWLSHWHVPRAMKRMAEDPAAYARAKWRHDVFLWGGSVIVGLGIPTVLYLVILRPY